MEYSLYHLNKNVNLRDIKITDIINKLNLIGFEIDGIFNEDLLANKFVKNIRFLIKIPSNRQDLLNENLFLNELETIFLFEIYHIWKKLKTKYAFLLKQKYRDEFYYRPKPILSELSDILLYKIHIKNFKKKKSPLWIQNKLRNAGILPFSNLTDYFNLILLEFGYTFNLYLTQTYSENGNFKLEKLTTSESFEIKKNQKIQLPAGSIVLKDESNNIINGLGISNNFLENTSENSMITDDFFLDVIFYDIYENKYALTSLNSKLSFSYLRKMFLEYFKFSFQRLLTLLEIISFSKISEIYCNQKKNIEIKPNNIIRLKKSLLKNILNSNTYQNDIFLKAGLKIICETDLEFYFNVAIFRKDLSRVIDLIEEYSRFIGYKNVLEILPQKNVNYVNQKQINYTSIKKFLINYGFNEVFTTSIDEDKNVILSSVKLINPLNNEFARLRGSLLPKLFQVFQLNSKLGFSHLNFFEIGRVFKISNKKIIEQDKLSAIFQMNNEKNINKSTSEWLIAKGFIENFLALFGYKDLFIEPINMKDNFFHPTRSIVIKNSGKILGYFGEINPGLENFNLIKNTTYFFDFNLHHFKKWRLNNSINVYKEYSKYPSVIKDISFLIAKTESFYELKEKIKAKSQYLQNITFFDTYFDNSFKNKVNIGLRLEFQSNKNTLITEIIEKEVNDIREYLIKTFEVEFR